MEFAVIEHQIVLIVGVAMADENRALSLFAGDHRFGAAERGVTQTELFVRCRVRGRTPGGGCAVQATTRTEQLVETAVFDDAVAPTGNAASDCCCATCPSHKASLAGVSAAATFSAKGERGGTYSWPWKMAVVSASCWMCRRMIPASRVGAWVQSIRSMLPPTQRQRGRASARRV